MTELKLGIVGAQVLVQDREGGPRDERGYMIYHDSGPPFSATVLGIGFSTHGWSLLLRLENGIVTCRYLGDNVRIGMTD